jgi:predicted PurR-regulated permease PerM
MTVTNLPPEGPEERRDLAAFGVRAVIAAVVLVVVHGLAVATWMVISTLMVLYLAVIVAIGLRGCAQAIARRTPLGVGPALAVVVLFLVAMPIGASVLLGPELVEQAALAEDRLPEFEARLDGWLSRVMVRVNKATGATAMGESTAATAPDEASDTDASATPTHDDANESEQATTPSEPTPQGPADMIIEQLQRGPASQIMGWMGSFVGGLSQAVLGVMLVSVVGVYLAASPGIYERGLILLVPIGSRPRVRTVLDELAGQLRAWLLAQVATMALVGVVTTVALMVMGMPMAILLGLMAGALDFVPNFGPAVAAVPALLVAGGEGKVIPVLVLYVVVQVVEGWLLRPMIEMKAVDTPPAMLIVSQVMMGTVVGFMGLLMAPAVVVLFTLFIRRFYVEDVLGDDTGPTGRAARAPDVERGAP